jgi:hypothetical protein
VTAAAVSLSAPESVASVELAEAALAAYREPAADRSADLDVLTWMAGERVERELRLWAERIATPDGFPLIGTGLTAPTYAALLWNGARLDGSAPEVGWAPLLAALAAADAEDARGLDRVFRALAAAEVVRRGAARLLTGSVPPVAWPTLATMGAAPAALLAGPRAGDGLVRVLDLGASLMVLTTGDGHSPASGLWTGHSAASGWLAARLPQEAVTPMAGSVVHTLSAAAGRAVGGETGHGSVADVLARLR